METLHRSPMLMGIGKSRWDLASLAEAVDWLRPGSTQARCQLLKRLGISYKRGRQYLHSPDLAYEAKLSRIQAALNQVVREPQRYVLLYEDEMTYYRRPTLAQAYGRAGQDDVRAWCGLKSNSQRRIAACLNVLTGQVTAWQRASFRLKTLLAFLRETQTVYPHAQTIFIALDNWPIHFHPFISQALASSRIVLLPLPTYAPWTNPVEKLWRKLRHDILHLHPLADDWSVLQAAVESWLAIFAPGSLDLLRYVGL
jgi:DDE superfamily endonuclease